MRIAIQLFGHLRTYKRTCENFNENIVGANASDADCDIDVFMHTWDELEARTSTWHSDNEGLRGQRLTQLDIEVLKGCYTSLKNIEISPSIDAHGSKISRGKVSRLRERYEEDKGIQYDWIIETRPDVLFNNLLRIKEFIDTFEEEQLILNGITADNVVLCGNGIFSRMNIAHPNYVCEGDMIYFYKSDVSWDTATRVPVDYLFLRDFQFLRDGRGEGKAVRNKKQGLAKKLLLQVVAGIIPSKLIRKKIRSL
jgi:hypothetical protein